MKLMVPVICIGLCIAVSCNKDHDPDLSVYAQKLAGNRAWKQKFIYGQSDILVGTTFLNDTTFAIEVKDDEHLSLYGYALSYTGYDNSMLLYSYELSPSSIIESVRLAYNRNTDSVNFSINFSNHKGSWSGNIFTTHL